MRALITGITGQDGSYLAEFLLSKGYEVWGIVRRSSSENFERINHIRDRIHLFEADLLDQTSLTRAVEAAKPNEVYNELYREARKKAKLAKKNAIIAYLEAKNIKKTYMIENINDSDSDFDNEIDEVSESELEGL